MVLTSEQAFSKIFCQALINSLTVFFSGMSRYIYDVNHDIEICSDLLDEGHIVVNIPDIESLSAKILRQNWPMYLDVHLHFFTRKSLCLLMAKHGFSLCDDWAHKQFCH